MSAKSDSNSLLMRESWLTLIRNVSVFNIPVFPRPVQLAHKLIERMKELRFPDVTPEEGKKYRHNSKSEANSPYIIVGTCDGVCSSSTFSALPNTPKVAGAYEHGILDGNLGQMVSFQSTYKSTFRIEVPVWPEVRVCWPLKKQACQRKTSTAPSVESNIQMAMSVPATQEETSEMPKATADPERDEEEVEDDTHVPPEGQGVFSFRQSLLLRAKDTYSARSNGNKCEVISKWLLTGLAVSSHGPTGMSSPKKHADVHPQGATQALLSTRTPG